MAAASAAADLFTRTDPCSRVISPDLRGLRIACRPHSARPVAVWLVRSALGKGCDPVKLWSESESGLPLDIKSPRAFCSICLY